ncbi:MAG: nucleotidyltransferase family protein [Burkholderiaceae bacterium]
MLARWESLDVDLPGAWLVAGCLFQTIWNLRAGRSPASGIKDYDIFYFDASDPSEAGERRAQAMADAVFSDLGVTIEVVNQARVHDWYPGYFGRPYPELGSVEDGIKRFLVLETCVGVRPDRCYAPFGLAGIYAGTLSPNPLTPYPELFARKVASYRRRWPFLGESSGASDGV